MDEMKMGGGIMGSMSIPITRNPVEAGPDPFPAGLRVLVVDDDPTCLIILEKMLRTCRYHVTKTNRAEVALTLLRENKNKFDVVISDVHMPDMDGFKLLEHVGLEMDLPVIMMSADDSKSVVMKGVTHGACDYLIKPVRIEALKNIWQHVVRKKKNEWKDLEQSSSWDEGDHQQKQDDAVSSPANEGSWKSSKRKVDDEDLDEKDDTSTLKKPRVVWSVELHQQFVAAVNQLGIDKSVPKKILELMNVPGLTRENVASHLQKYRLYLRRLSRVSQHQGALNGSFMSDSGFDAMSQLSGIDVQTLHATGHLSAQTLAAYTGLPPIRPGLSMPFTDQRNVLSFENAPLRYMDRQEQKQQQQFGNVSKQMNLLHGIPTMIDSKQLGGLNQSAQNLRNMNMQTSASSCHQISLLPMPMAPQQSRGQLFNESVGGHVSQVQPSIGQPMQSNKACNNPVSQAGQDNYSSTNQILDLPGNNFPLGSTPGLTSMASKGFNQEGKRNNPDIKSVKGYLGSYDVFSEAQVQIPNTSFGGPSRDAKFVHNSVSVGPSTLVNQSCTSQKAHKNGNSLTSTPMLVNQSYITTQKADQNRNSCTGNPMLSSGLDDQHIVIQNVNHNVNDVLVDNTPRVKAETHLFAELYGQDDLMYALLKQQEGIRSGEYDFNAYSLDNIPV